MVAEEALPRQGPFFAYGIFKPGQLAFRRLRDVVEIVEPRASVLGELLERDGLPILMLGSSGAVKGALLRFRPDVESEAYRRIMELEPEKQYEWRRVQVVLPAGEVEATALVGRSPLKGSIPLESDDWNGADDPLFTTGLLVVREVLLNSSEFAWDLKPLFRLEMAYLLLWSAIERFASFSYHLGAEPWQKVRQLATEPAFVSALRREVSEERLLFRADRSGQSVRLSPENPAQAVAYYYQVRSNISHRGKGVVRDFETLQKSLSELLAIFRSVLSDVFGEK